MPLEVQTQEYVKSDYGMLYMGSHLNISKRPWSFGQVCDTLYTTIVNASYIITALYHKPLPVNYFIRNKQT